MKVKQLIELLKSYPESMEVWTAQDPEGNGFNKLTGISDEGSYVEVGETWTDNLFHDEDFEEMDTDNTPVYNKKDFKKVLVIWP